MGTRVAPDSDSLLYYKFDSLSPFVNTGALGTAKNMTSLSGESSLHLGGTKFGPVFRDGGCLAFNTDVSGGPASIQLAHFTWPTQNITVSGWFTWYRTAGGTGNIERTFFKWWTPTGWASPYVGMSLWEFQNAAMYQGSVGYGVSSNVGASLARQLGLPPMWMAHHVGLTYGDGNLKTYIDGQLSLTVAQAGALNLGTGPWAIGADGGGSASHAGFLCEEIRICQVVRNAEWFASVYQAGIPSAGIGRRQVLARVL